MMAALMAPIEMPAIQSGWMSAFGQRLVDASLICPQRTAALQKQGDAFEGQLSFRCREVWLKLKIHCVLLV